METRTAPRAIRETEQRYQRAHTVWACANVLWWLGWLALTLTPVRWSYPRLVFIGAWVGLLILRADKRARRYGTAARELNAAIARYEASPDRPEPLLGEADRRARETLRVERIKTAPAWVRDMRRRCRLRILGWYGPALLAVALPAAGTLLGFRLARPWQMFAAAAVPIPLLIGAMIGTRKLTRAVGILGEAIEPYEFESAAAESDLDEAGRRANQVLAGRSGRGGPAG